MPSRTPKRALAAVFAAVPLVTCVFAVQGVCAEPPADVGPASVYMELELNYGGHAIATRKTRWADNPSASVDPSLHARHALLV